MADSFDLGNPATYTPAKGMQRRNFNYTVQIQSASPSGLPMTQHITVASNQILSEAQILEIAGGYLETAKYEGVGVSVESMDVVGAIRSTGLGSDIGSAITSTLE